MYAKKFPTSSILKCKSKYFFVGLLAAVIWMCNFQQEAARAAVHADGNLRAEFLHPPRKYRTYAWWHWMGLTISKYGIKRDLTAMNRAGIAGVTICPIASQASVGKDMENSGVPPVYYWSPKWWGMVKYACRTAQKLHMKVGLENCPGFSASGGPWITPALSMKKIVWTVTTVHGPASVQLKLRRPHAIQHLYEDVCVLAVPVTKIVKPGTILNISRDLNAQGLLTWRAPAGTWRIFRYGYTSTGSQDIPKPDDIGRSLEADKLSVKAATFHIEHVIHGVENHLGPFVGRTFTHLLFDSYEAGSQTWTKHFRSDFIAMRHYDPLPWLPTLDGIIVGSRTQTQKFKYDFKRTIAQLFKLHDFDVYHKLIDAAGLKMCLEPYTGPFNTIACADACDVTMGEFWNASSSGIAWNVAGAARADGRRIVGAETLTGHPWESMLNETPESLKPTLDGGLLSGVNRCYLHDWTLQALNKKYKPGILMAWWGSHFGENETWYKPGIAFFTYLNRCLTMLRQGQQVCDSCTLNCKPTQLSMDAASLSLFYRATVQNGKIVLPSGRSYFVMVLPRTQLMLPRVAKKLESLVAAGAVIIGPRPTASPSLTDYPACDAQVAAIGRKVWGDCNGTTIKEHRYGKGMVAWNVSVDDMLRQLGVPPDFQAPAPLVAIHRHARGLDIYFVVNRGHSPLATTAWFDVADKVPELWYAASGRQVTAGDYSEVHGGTAVPLQLDPLESVFVVFRHRTGHVDHVVHIFRHHHLSTRSEVVLNSDRRLELITPKAGDYDLTFAQGQKTKVVVPALPKPFSIHGPWQIRFTPGWGAPARAEFSHLMSWTDSTDGGIKYFSGSGTYIKTIRIPSQFIGTGRQIILSLGRVDEMAQVWVNGKDMGVLWYAPFKVNITSAIKPGINRLRIVATDTWQNRLIGDDQLPTHMQWGRPRWHPVGHPHLGGPLVRFPNWVIHNLPRPTPGRYTFETWNYYHKSSPLHPSGLIGPVKLVAEARVEIPHPGTP